MSRIGKLPITVPAGVEVNISDKNLVTVKGPKGELKEQLSSKINIENKDGVLTFTRNSDQKEERSLHGLSRALVNNMIKGVTEGFQKKLVLVGVGYRAEKKGDTLVLSLGYSHPIEVKDTADVKTEVPGPNEIIVSGINKTLVGDFAADIRAPAADQLHLLRQRHVQKRFIGFRFDPVIAVHKSNVFSPGHVDGGVSGAA